MSKEENHLNNQQKKSEIHPTAVVDPDIKMGKGVSIGPGTIVEKNVKIGDGTRIDSFAKIGYGARIGKECHFFHGAVISEIPQNLKFHGEDSRPELLQ